MRIGFIAGLGLIMLATGTASAQTSVYLDELTWPEIQAAQAAGRTTAIIYTGGIEQNGHHMVLSKHNVIARHVGGQIAERLGDALMFPVIPFSLNGDPLLKQGHMRWPGTISVSSDVFLGVVRDVVVSAAVGGFENIFLMGDHGPGNAELELAAEGLDAEWRGRGVRVYYVSDLNGKANRQMAAYLAERGIAAGGHAGVAETAQVLALDADGTLLRHDEFAIAAAGPTDVVGTSGDPSLATVEMGRAFLEFKIAAATAQIRQFLEP